MRHINPNVLRVVQAVSEVSSVPVSAILGKDRCRSVKCARLIVYLVTGEWGATSVMSAAEVGRALKRDHSSVLAGRYSAIMMLEQIPETQRWRDNALAILRVSSELEVVPRLSPNLSPRKPTTCTELTPNACCGGEFA